VLLTQCSLMFGSILYAGVWATFSPELVSVTFKASSNTLHNEVRQTTQYKLKPWPCHRKAGSCIWRINVPLMRLICFNHENCLFEDSLCRTCNTTENESTGWRTTGITDGASSETLAFRALILSLEYTTVRKKIVVCWTTSLVVLFLVPIVYWK
jgi:hypothetical protein